MLKKERITERVWAIYSDTQEEIGKAFVRFQEYYENPEMKGRKNIIVREVEQWWDRTKSDTKDSYYEHWVGFNIPGRIFLELCVDPNFRSGFSLLDFLENPRSYPRFYKQEDELLALLSDLTVEEIGTGYFIGVMKSSTTVLDHEIAHAFFATIPTYTSEQLYNISQLPKDIYEKIRNDLISCGYHPTVVHDEIQAYLATYADDLKETFETDEYNQFTPSFEATFKKFNYRGFEI